MKKLFGIMLVVMFMFSLSLVSATAIVTGVVYSGEITNPVGGADVLVACNHYGIMSYRNTTSNTTTGWYGVSFPEKGTGACNNGDEVIVYATTTDGLYGESKPVIVIDNMIGKLDVAIANVPMVPEFGFFVGMLTILSATVVFFVVRKE